MGQIWCVSQRSRIHNDLAGPILRSLISAAKVFMDFDFDRYFPFHIIYRPALHPGCARRICTSISWLLLRFVVGGIAPYPESPREKAAIASSLNALQIRGNCFIV